MCVGTSSEAGEPQRPSTAKLRALFWQSCRLPSSHKFQSVPSFPSCSCSARPGAGTVPLWDRWLLRGTSTAGFLPGTPCLVQELPGPS